MKKLLSLFAVMFYLMSAQEAHGQTVAMTSGPSVQRMSDIRFTPDRSFLENGNFQYFYSLSDVDFVANQVTRNPNDPTSQNSSNGLTEISAMDSQHIFQSDWSERNLLSGCKVGQSVGL